MDRIIKGFSNYSINEFGEIKNVKKGTILKGGLDTGGYRIVTLRKNNRNYTKTIHRLVAEAFIDNPDNLPCVNHKDENKQNNKVENLEWCTYQYNNTYGTFLKRRSESRYKKVAQYDLQGNLLNIFNGITIAAKETKTKGSNISLVCKGKRNQAGGYKWKYVNR